MKYQMISWSDMMDYPRFRKIITEAVACSKCKVAAGSRCTGCGNGISPEQYNIHLVRREYYNQQNAELNIIAEWREEIVEEFKQTILKEARDGPTESTA